MYTAVHQILPHINSAAVSCMSLADPMNGVVEVNSTTFNSQANYSCNVGFVLVGDSNRTCQADTTWTGEQPDCELTVHWSSS